MSDPEKASDVGVNTRSALKIGLGFAVGVVLVYLLGVVVGWERTLERLRMAQWRWVVVGCLSTVLCLVAWGKTWQIILRTIGVDVPFRKLIVTFFAATFANYVTPMGQAGGEPFIAYILSQDTSASYEESLASVVTTDIIRLLPFFTFGGVGVAYLILDSQLPARIERYVILLGVLAVVIPGSIIVSWRFRYGMKDAVLALVGPIARRTSRIDIDGLRQRFDELLESIEVIATSPRSLFQAILLAYVGWVLFALPLFFAGLAVGLSVPLLLVAFLVPVTVIAGSTPLPGGVAAIEGTLVVLLSALLAISSADAFAIATVYRLANYWFVIAVGGVATFWVLRRV